jgi:alpha-1,3-glucan synthase
LGTQLRAGGDVQGIVDSLDYLYTLGIRGVYLVGSPMINLPWESDQYSAVDHTILDHHLGNISAWRSAIEAIHSKGMYVLLDNTMATMSNLLGWSDYQNSSAPWSFEEHPAMWKSERQYVDWSFDNEYLEECDVPYPRFWDEDGIRINDNYTASMVGCMDSEFDQYGDIGAFDIAPEWRKQLTKFGGVQDRLSEWKPSVRKKIEHFSCMMITALDFDGFRMDKGMQIGVDAQGNFSAAMRACALQHGKDNFFITGEIVSGNVNGAIYIGRGKEPGMTFNTTEEAFRSQGSNLSNSTAETIRSAGQSAFDSAAFHYSVYRAFVHVLGVNGHLTAPGDTNFNFAEAWNEMVLTNDFANTFTGEFDPRHLYGVENQDTFRWSGIENGPARHGLGAFITTLTLPGLPLVSWGEEQAFYTLDSTAANYLFGRQPMSSAQAWQMHGCYKVGDDTPAQPDFNSTLVACQDDSVSLDHRDQSHPKYNIFRMMFAMRERYPVLNDGWILTQLSNDTYEYTLSDASGIATEVGLYSLLRSQFFELQNFTGIGQGNVDVWLLYSNENTSRIYESSCDSDSATLAPFDVGTKVKNLFYPFDEYTLQNSTSQDNYSCLPSMNMTAFGYKAFVPSSYWLSPAPHVTKFSPGHDARLLSAVAAGSQDTVAISLEFSHEMNCSEVAAAISVASTVEDGSSADIDLSSVSCFVGKYDTNVPLTGAMPSAWTLSTDLVNVSNGVHVITIANVSASVGDNQTDATGIVKFMLRIGQSDNPMVFPTSANYSSTLLFKSAGENSSSPSEQLYIAQKAAGADLFRYSTNWGSSWSSWQSYQGGNITVQPQVWTGTARQRWDRDHVMVQYWSKATGSSNHYQEGDVFISGSSTPARRFPHAFVHGSFNEYGYDAGLSNEMKQDANGIWNWDLMTEWPAQFQVNIWGMNPDGKPDMTKAFGDIDNDTVLDRLSPASLQEAIVNITAMVGGENLGPPSPFLAWRIQVNDGTLRYTLVPVGSRWAQLVIFVLFALIPLLTAVVGVMVYQGAFYKVKFNTVGLSKRVPIVRVSKIKEKMPFLFDKYVAVTGSLGLTASSTPTRSPTPTASPSGFFGLQPERRTVLIATIEFDIEDWGIKVKIGGLGVMAQVRSTIPRRPPDRGLVSYAFQLNGHTDVFHSSWARTLANRI